MITHYGVETIQDEVRRLLCAGALRPSECISHLQGYFPAREWCAIEEELLFQDYQLSDAVSDLIGSQEWNDD